jgi:hypothetical protein
MQPSTPLGPDQVNVLLLLLVEKDRCKEADREGKKEKKERRKEKTIGRKLEKDSVFEALRPLTLILPEGDHGYREGMPANVAEPREETSQEEPRPVLTNEAEDLEAVPDVLGEIQRCTGVDIVPTLRSSRPVTPQSPRTYFTSEKK